MKVDWSRLLQAATMTGILMVCALIVGVTVILVMTAPTWIMWSVLAGAYGVVTYALYRSGSIL